MLVLKKCLRVIHNSFVAVFLFYLTAFRLMSCRLLQALLEYEKHKMRSGELPFAEAAFAEPTSSGIQVLLFIHLARCY